VLSDFAFNFNLRRYTVGFGIGISWTFGSPMPTPKYFELEFGFMAGAYTRPLFGST